MSVAPRAAPSMSGRSRMISRRGSHREEEEIAVGAVVVMLSDKSDDQNTAAYRVPTAENGQDGAKPLFTASSQKDQCFMAVLAPNGDTAMASLLTQPPGTYLLVIEEDAAIDVYVKFRQAVRALTLVKGKEVKKNDEAIQLAKLRKKDLDVLMQTPVHNLRLSSEAYFLVERCWKRFLPQVQAVVFELCCETYLDEEAKLEDWTTAMIPPSAYSLGLMPDACGFYILAVPGSGADASTASVIHVRQVEFDFNRFAIAVADGTLKPSALLLATSFSSKRTFEAVFTFSAIRDNFLTPDQVILKETSVHTHLSHQSSLLNCIDLGSTDAELAVLSAAEAMCGTIFPHKPLPDSFLTVLHEMHVHFGNVVSRSQASEKPAHWTTQKMRLVSGIIPTLVELLIASAAFSESKSSADLMDAYAVAAENNKRQTLAQFAHSMRFDILFMTARSDGSVLCRLAHQLCQLLGARIRIPAELVDFIRDLMALFPVFLRLFLRNQGAGTLWKNLHHNDLEKEDASSDSRMPRTFRSFRALTSSRTVVNAFQLKGERKQSLFRLARKPVTKSRKSLSLGTSLSTAPFLSSKALAFFRLSPLSVHVYLGTQLREGYFTFPDIWKEDPALYNITFCCCVGPAFGEPGATSRHAAWLSSSELKSICARKRRRSSAKMVTFELLLQLSLRFLYHKTSFENWDRDVALLLRLEDVHQHLFNEIIKIVRQRADTRDISTTDALNCELRMVIACVSTLFRLERKRRQEISSAVGEKKYLAFVYSFRTKLRELNERLREEAACGRSQTEEGEEDGVQNFTNYRLLLALAEVFKWIPRAFLNEWIVLCLKDLLQTVNELSNAIKQTPLPLLKQVQYVRDIHEVFQVFAIMLKRTSDVDIQIILVRALGMNCALVTTLLRFAILPQSLSLNGGRDAVSIQVHVLNFLNAFVNLDIVLPVQTHWESMNRKPSEEGIMNEDTEIIEQLKGDLLIRVLSPRMTLEDGDQNDQTLWDFMLELMFPSIGTNTIISFNSFIATSRMLGIAAAFRSTATPPILLTTISKGHFQMKESFLLLLQALYTAQDVSSQVDYESCVASHLRRIEQYSDRIIANEGQEDTYMVFRVVELNLRCLIVLASRRSQFPAIQEAFNHVQVISRILNRLQTQEPLQRDPISTRSHDELSCPTIGDDTGTALPSLPSLKLPCQFSADKGDAVGIQPAVSKLSLPMPSSAISAAVEVNVAQNFLLSEPGLHVSALVLVASFVIADPNLEIDEQVCPRIYVPTEADSSKSSDLLWTLQQHLAVVEMDQRYLEALLVELETLQALVSTERLSAVRSLLKLLNPTCFDCNLYTNHAGDNHAREYVAKGAFSTVYRQHPALPHPETVAVKVVEHQRRAGEMCAVSGVFNEVSILSKLRGNLAATQLADFGNHHTEQSFEIVMEYCPCSLTEWRATIKQSESEVPFRSNLVMILRAFEEASGCLTRIHQAGVCHFDIKSDNILVRSDARELSCRLLENQEPQDNSPSSDLTGWLCFADFGESKVLDADSVPVRTFTFSSFSSGTATPVAVRKQADKFMSLSRTRGTEAIKSPEVLKVKGSEEVQAKVTLASDIWSLGCLLYELVTQELLFQNDDWAALYAHLIVTQDQPVLRSDHKQKIFAALQPTCSEEEQVVTSLVELCNTILVREPTKRPTLVAITTQICKLITDVYKLPVTASDESFIIGLYQSNEDTSESPRFMSALRPFANTRPTRSHHGVIVPVRLFWNFFIAAHVARTRNVQILSSCLGASSGPACKDVLAMDAFEAMYEAHFVHFVYLSWHESSSETNNLIPHAEASGLIHELHEEEHRTCFLLNPQLQSSVESLVQQLVQHAPEYFPVLQRRLRDEAGCVVFVGLGKDKEDTEELQHVVMGMLLFFLRSAFDLSVFDLLSSFARDCAQFLAYPRPEFIQHVQSYSVSLLEPSSHSTIVQCRCGSNVFTVEASALTEAFAARHCTCTTKDKEPGDCRCFHPFPMPHESEDEAFPIDNMFIHDAAEEQLVLPLETRSKRGQEVKWLSLDVGRVGRADTSAFRWSPAAHRLQPPSSSSESVETTRRTSRFRKLTRRGSTSNSSSHLSGREATQRTAEPQELLVRGLQRRGKLSDASSFDSWDLYECPLCRLPVCALSQGTIALPLL